MVRLLALIPSLLGAQVLASPLGRGAIEGHSILQRQNEGCQTSTSYQNLAQSDPYDGAPQRVSGYRCKSTNTACALGKEATYEVETSYTVSGGISGGLDLGKVFTLGVEAGFAYTWGTSKGTSVSITAYCDLPFGECGLRVIPKFIEVTGQVKVDVIDSSPFCTPGSGSWNDFSIEAPYLQGTAPTDEQNAAMTFAACLTKCDPGEGCDTGNMLEANIPPCP